MNGYWWAAKDGKLVPVQVKNGSVLQLGDPEPTAKDEWKLVKLIEAPGSEHDFLPEVRQRAVEIMEHQEGRMAMWFQWCERNQDILKVGKGFCWRIGFDSFEVGCYYGRYFPAYQQMASSDHQMKEKVGEPTPIQQWDVGTLDTWEKMYPRLKPHLETLVRSRWFRRDGIWPKGQAPYDDDPAIIDLDEAKEIMSKKERMKEMRKKRQEKKAAQRRKE